MRAAGWIAIAMLVLGAAPRAGAAPAPSRAAVRPAGRVNPHWRRALVLSFRSPDLLSNDADERWGAEDDRLRAGGIVTDFPLWLKEQQPVIVGARAEGRPIILSVATHGGYGLGLVTYSLDLKRAQVANYPWLVRQLLAVGLGEPDVTVTVDTCNAQAASAYQLRPDLVPRGVAAWSEFSAWKRAGRGRQSLALGKAWAAFARDRMRAHLAPSARRSARAVEAVEYVPLTHDERSRFRARLYGPRGVIFGTPAFFNVLRLGPDTRGTLTADLLNDRLEPRVVDSLLSRNTAEFRAFRDFAFLASAGADPVSPPPAPVPTAAALPP